MERLEPQPMNQSELSRYMDEMMRYRSLNPKPRRNEAVIPAMSSAVMDDQSVMPPVISPIMPPPAVLPTTIPPAASNKTPEELYQIYQKENPQTGNLRVQAFTARRTYHVPDAVVEVSKNFPSGRYVIARMVTDQSGATEMISLPAPDKDLSEVPGNTHLFTRVDVKVKHKNFVETNFLDVPVFQGITSNQIADMMPLAAAPDGMRSIDLVEHEPTDL